MDLLYAMCGRSNVQTIVAEMLVYLETADYAIREEMVSCHFVLYCALCVCVHICDVFCVHICRFTEAHLQTAEIMYSSAFVTVYPVSQKKQVTYSYP